MEFSFREWIGSLHGFIFGGAFLLAFSAGIYALYSLKPGLLTPDGLKQRVKQLKVWVWGMAAAAWGTVYTGTFILYPWYRTKPPEGTTDLAPFARYFLLSSEATALWHEFGMEWKEHVGWITPIATTVVAYVITVYGEELVEYPNLRKALIWFFIIAFTAASVAGVLGALITKVAPIR